MKTSRLSKVCDLLIAVLFALVLVPSFVFGLNFIDKVVSVSNFDAERLKAENLADFRRYNCVATSRDKSIIFAVPFVMYRQGDKDYSAQNITGEFIWFSCEK